MYGGPGGYCSTPSGVTLWDARTGKELRRIPVRPGPFVLSPDDRLLAGRGDEGLALWETDTGRKVRTIRAATDGIERLSITADEGLLVASTDSDFPDLVENRRRMHAWRLATSEAWQVPEPGQEIVDAAEDGRSILTGVPRTGQPWKDLRLCDTASGRVRAVIPGEGTPVQPFSVDGRYLCINQSNAFSVWNAHTGEKLREEAGLLFTRFMGRGKTYLASRNARRGHRLIDTETGRTLRTFDAETTQLFGPTLPTGPTLWMDYTEGAWLAVLSRDKLVVIDGATGQDRATVELPQARVPLMGSTPDGEMLISTVSGVPRFWDRMGRARDVIPRTVRVGIVLEDGRVLTEEATSRLVLIEPMSGKVHRTFDGLAGSPLTLAASTDGRLLAALCEMPQEEGRLEVVQVWETATGRLVRQVEGRRLAGPRTVGFPGTGTPIPQLVFSPDGRRLALGGLASADELLWQQALGWKNPAGPSPVGSLDVAAQEEVRLWDLDTGEAAPPLVHDGPVFTLAFAPDSRSLVTSSRGGQMLPGMERLSFLGLAVGELCRWECDTGRRRERHEMNCWLSGLHFNSDGRALVAGGVQVGIGPRLGETATLILDGESLRERARRPGEGSPAVCLTPDGRSVARLFEPAGRPAAVQLWDVESAQLRATLPAEIFTRPPDSIQQGSFMQPRSVRLRFSRDGLTLLAWGRNAYRSWHAEPPRR